MALASPSAAPSRLSLRTSSRRTAPSSSPRPCALTPALTALLSRNNQNKGYFALFLLAQVVRAADVPDPYRWLEDAKSPLVQVWVQEQNKNAEAYLSKIPGQGKIAARLKELYYVDSVALPQPAGGRLFYEKVFATRYNPLFDLRDQSGTGPDNLW